MGKRVLMMLHAATLISSLGIAYLTSAHFSEANIRELSLEKKEQVVNTENNSKTLRKLLRKVTLLQQQIHLQSGVKTEDVVIKTLPETDNRLKQLSINLASLKQEVDILTKLTKESLNGLTRNINTLPTGYIPERNNDKTITIEARNEKRKRETALTEATYESILNEGENDDNWTTEIEGKIDGLISANKLGENVNLQSLECKTKLCKIYFSDPHGTLNEDDLFLSLGNVSAYVTKKENGGFDQQETIIFISRANEMLPRIGASIN